MKEQIPQFHAKRPGCKGKYFKWAVFDLAQGHKPLGVPHCPFACATAKFACGQNKPGWPAGGFVCLVVALNNNP
jgi:hypothetical protein